MGNALKKSWISRIIESEYPLKIKNPLFSSIIKFGAIFDFSFLIFYLARKEYMSDGFLFGYILGLIWLNITPYIVWYYERRIIPNFFKSSTELVTNNNILNRIEENRKNFFLRSYIIFLIPWMVFFIYTNLTLGSTIPNSSGIFGKDDLFYWIILILYGGWVAIIQANGLSGVSTTLLIIRDISKENLNIDPLNPDKLGGLGVIGNFAIATTLLLSEGSLLIPLPLQIFSQIPLTQNYFYIFVFIFAFLIFLSFLYPTIIIHIKARKIRDEKLEKLKNEYYRLKSRLNNEESKLINIDIKYFINFYRIREEYEDYSNVRLYPFEIEIFVKLISSVILPVILLLIQKYLGML